MSHTYVNDTKYVTHYKAGIANVHTIKKTAAMLSRAKETEIKKN